MTYDELIKSSFDYLLNEDIADQLLSLDLNDELPLEIIKEELKKLKLYFTLFILNKRNLLSGTILNLFKLLEEYFNEYIPNVHGSIKATLENKHKSTMEKLEENEVTSQIIEQINTIALPDDELEYLKNYLTNEYLEIYDSIDLEDITVEELFSPAIYEVIDVSLPVLPILFFTKNGSKYINNNFWIEDDGLREKAYSYAIKQYADPNLSNEYYTRDMNMYSVLYANVQIHQIIYELTIQGKLDYLIKMDSYIEQNFEFIGYRVPLLALLVQYKKVEEIKFDEIIKDDSYKPYLDFFFNENSITNSLTPEEKALLIIIYFYGKPKENILSDISDNWNNIVDVLKSDDNKYAKEKKIKKISKIF